MADDAGTAPTSGPPPVSAGAVSARSKSRRGRLPGTEGSKRARDLAVAASAGIGWNPAEIARAMGLARFAVTEILKKPDIKAHMEEVRRAHQALNLANAVGMTQQAWDRARGALAADDARKFDAYTRGIYSVERTASNAAGESRRFEVDSRNLHISQVDVGVELRGLLKDLGVVIEAGR